MKMKISTWVTPFLAIYFVGAIYITITTFSRMWKPYKLPFNNMPASVHHTPPAYMKTSNIKTQNMPKPKDEFQFTPLSKIETYLRLNTLLYPHLDYKSVSNETRKKFEDIIRKGLHLQPYFTARGESGWMENGIVYRPWRRPDPSTMHKTHPSPFYAEYEPYVPFDEKMFFAGRLPPPGYGKVKRKIISWSPPTRYYNKSLPHPEPLKSCPDFPCLMTTNKTYIPSSAAVIFTAQLITWKNRMPRNPDQVYVLHNHEPPFENKLWRINAKSFRHHSWKKAFNYTMTYRTDSDFVVPYGIIRKRPEPIKNKDYEAIVKQKDKLVVWIVSNCNTSSKRWEYVEELKNYMTIDVYGKCGTLSCPHAEKDKCDDMMAKRYKFYLAFENAYCQDYITEKLFHYLSIDTLVVARGIDQYYQHVPPEVFLNTADFPSPKALAERMLYLHHNDDAYIEMLKEKDKFVTIAEGYPVRDEVDYIKSLAFRFEASSICLLCQRLWNLDLYAKTIPDIHVWFDKRVCRKRDEVQLEF